MRARRRAGLGALLIIAAGAAGAAGPARAADRPAYETRFFAAVVRGDVAAVRAAIRAHKGLLEQWNHPHTDTPLMVAANRCDLPMVKALLALGANPNAAPHARYHLTPIFMALMGSVYAGEEKTVERMDATLKLLLEAGADPNAWYVPGEGAPRQTAVLSAAELLPSTLRVLVDHAGDVRLRDEWGRSAVELALRSASRGIDDAVVLAKVELLLGAGHPLPKDEAEAATWLGLAWSYRLDAVEALLREKGLSLPEKSSYAPYLAKVAVASGSLPRLEQVLAQKPDLRAPTARPLLAQALIAAGPILERHPGWRGDVERAALRLLDAGAGAAADKDTITPLLMAARMGMPALFERLAGLPDAKLDDADAQGRTALHLAAEAGDVQLIDALVRRKAPAGARDRKGDTPLVTAVRALQVRAVERLIPVTLDELPRAREAALQLACDAEARKKDGLAGVLGFLAARSPLTEAEGERLKACAPGLWRHVAPPQTALAPGESAEALVLRAPEAQLEGWRAAWGRMEAGLSPWLELAAPLPRVAGGDELGGGGPGLLLGVCREGEGVVQERWLRALLPDLERRPVAWQGPLACPAAVTALGPSTVDRLRRKGVPGYRAMVLAPAPAGTSRRGFVSIAVGDDGAVAGFGVGDDGGYAAGCADDYDERVELTTTGGTVTLACGDRRRRWTVQPQGGELVFRQR